MNDIEALFRRLTVGVYVVGAAHKNQRDAFTAAWLTQASFDPLLLALSINPHNACYALLKASAAFTVSVLKQGQLALARRYGTQSGRVVDKLAGSPMRLGRSGAPILEDALAYFDCELIGSLTAGDHELVLGRVVDGRVMDSSGIPMVYAETGDMDGSGSLYPPTFDLASPPPTR